MNKHLIKLQLLLVILLHFIPSVTNGQNKVNRKINYGFRNKKIWLFINENKIYNFYEIKRQFTLHWFWKEREMYRERKNGQKFYLENESKESEYFHYKRKEYYLSSRVYPSGDITLPSKTWDFFEKYLKTNKVADSIYRLNRINNNWFTSNNAYKNSSTSNLTAGAGWSFVGPIGTPNGGGSGRINCIKFVPGNANTIFVGAPVGGLWKSTNGGQTWNTNTDLLSVIGVSDIVIDSINPQIMYLATGDGDHSDCYSIGVLKTIDGGLNWNPTGLSWTVNQGRVINKLLINPKNNNTIWAATSNGLYRTYNAGSTWTQVLTGRFYDIEYKAMDTIGVYACTGSLFYRSINGGKNFTNITTGVPTSISRLSIAVTNADSSYVYLLACQNSASSYGFKGVYLSTNSGLSFSTKSTTPNLLGWASAGNDVGGQGWYTLSIAASPINKNEIIVGGVNIWRSTNAGVNWTLNAHWTGSGAPYVHADIHALEYLPNNSTYFAGTDGGIFKTSNNGNAWSDLSNNLCIAQIYRVGQSFTNSGLFITGHQDNGTNLHLNINAYNYVLGGDGMDCFIDKLNPSIMYGEQYNGNYNRSTNGGSTWTNIVAGISGTAAWVSPWYQDPNNSNTIFGGYNNLFKSTNKGTSWIQLGTQPSATPNIVDFKIAPSNSQIIYVIKDTSISKTIDGGITWTRINRPFMSAVLKSIDIKSNDPNSIVISYSGYSSGNKIFKSTNGGTSFTNISTGLPNLPINVVRWEPNTLNDAIYAGADVGVYYLDNSYSSWQSFFTNLPNCVIDDLDFDLNSSKIIAATFGRGIWTSPLYNPTQQSPFAFFNVSKTSLCPGENISVTNQSLFNPTTYNWSFPGGVPSSSTSQNPGNVSYNTPGSYIITLTASNSTSSTTYSQQIQVRSPLNLNYSESFENNFLPNNWSAQNTTSNWMQANNGKNSSKSASFDNYNVNGSGQIEGIITPLFALQNYANAKLKFDVAYAPYGSGYYDSLSVAVSNDCGLNWNIIYTKGGAGLATNGGTNITAAKFVPTNTQWRTDSLNLSSYIGQNILISFRNHGHFGQALYIDNINISGTPNIPLSNFSLSSDTICVGANLQITNTSSGIITSYSWSAPFANQSTPTNLNPIISYSSPGTYTITLSNYNSGGTSTRSQTILVLPNLIPSISISSNSSNFCQGSLVQINANTYNAGAIPTYIFFKNNTIISNSNNNTLSINNINNHDSIRCLLISNNKCQVKDSTWSNTLFFNVTNPVTPIISISSSNKWHCPNQPIVYHSNYINAGTSALFNFYKNGNLIQSSNIDSLTIANFVNNDIIYCVLTSSITCLNSNNIVSNYDTIYLLTNNSTINIQASHNYLCQTNTLNINATTSNIPTNTQLQLFINGNFQTSFPSNLITLNNYNLGDTIRLRCLLNNNCFSNLLISSNDIIIDTSLFSIKNSLKKPFASFTNLTSNSTTLNLSHNDPCATSYLGMISTAIINFIPSNSTNNFYGSSIFGQGQNISNNTFCFTSSNISNYSITNLLPSTTYYVRLYSYNNGIWSIQPFDTSFTTPNVVISNVIGDNPCTARNFSSNNPQWGGGNNILSAYDGGSTIFLGQTNNSSNYPPTGVNCVYFSGNTSSASNLGINEPIPLCGIMGSNSKTLWFKFKAPTIGGIDIRLRTLFNGIPTNFNTTIAAYYFPNDPCNSNNSYINLACSTNGVLNFPSSVGILAPYAGQFIYVQLSGNGITSPFGNYALSIQAIPQNIALSNPTTSSLSVTIPTLPGATNISLQWRMQGTNGYNTINLNPSVTAYNITGLLSGVNYQVWAKYSNSTQAFYSNYSTLSTTIGCSATPSAPTIKNVLNHCSRDTIEWNPHPLANNTYPYRLYWLNINTQPNGYNVIAVPSSAFNTLNNKIDVLLNNLVPNNTYNFFYRVICQGGAQVVSNVSTFSQCNGPAKTNETCNNDYQINDIYYTKPTFQEIALLTDNTPSDGKPHYIDISNYKLVSTSQDSTYINTTYNLNLNDDFILNPNPASTKIKVQLMNPEIKNYEVGVYSIQGTLLTSFKILKNYTNNTFEIDINDLTPGVYFINIVTDISNTTKQLIIVPRN